MKKKVISLLLCGTMLAALCTGCADRSSDGENPSTVQTKGQVSEESKGTVEEPKELIEITELIWDRGTIPSSMGDLENNWWVDYVNEQMAPLGIKVNYVTVPKNQNTEILSTMMAAQNAPDLVKVSDMALLKSFVSSGGVADMSPYIEKYGDNLKTYYSEKELQDGQIDGAQYYLWHKQNDFMRTTFIREDWLDILGMNMPTTPEELRDVLVAIKEKDPGKVGDALVPMGMSTQLFMGWDMVILPAFLKEKPDAEKLLTPMIMWPEAKECFRYLNGLYNDGLLGEFILDKDESLFRQKIARGEMGVFIQNGQYPYHSAYGNLYDTLRKNVPDAKLTAVWTFSNENKENYYQLYATPPTYKYCWFIPSSSKNVEAVVKYLNWMASDAGYMVGCLGIEGEDYVMENGVPKVTLAEGADSRVTWIEPQYGTIGKPYSASADKDKFMLNYIKDFNPDYHEEILATAKCLSDVTFFPPIVNKPTPLSDKYAAPLSQLLNDNLAKIVCASKDTFDKVFDDFVADYASSGGQETADEKIAAYKEMTGN